MLILIGKMLAVIAVHLVATVLLWKRFGGERLSVSERLLTGVLYGLFAVFSNHFSVNYEHALLNIRDLSPLVAGLFFDPVSGILAGLIGGIERYVIGTYFGIGEYTRIACSVSTCLAGFFAAFLSVHVFKRKRPSALDALFMGAVTEVFHMDLVFITHKNDIVKALDVVRNCSPGMIGFTALGMLLTSLMLQVLSGEWRNPFRRMPGEKVPTLRKFRFWLSVFTLTILAGDFVFSYHLLTQKARQDAEAMFYVISEDIRSTYDHLQQVGHDDIDNMEYHIRKTGSFFILRGNDCIASTDTLLGIPGDVMEIADSRKEGELFTANIFGGEALCMVRFLDEETRLLITLPLSELYSDRDTQAYETMFGNIIMMALLYILIMLLVQNIIVENLETVNGSLQRIAGGDLKEEVSAYNTMEFASLSGGINRMVTALKGYIKAAEERVEQELKLAGSIQESALPHNFTFDRKDFEIYASMNPARQVGGDFYDFFMLGEDRLALVIADVSGKGIPASLFMMQSKTAIRTIAEKGLGPGEILERVNGDLKEGNVEKMFVTVWLGIINLKTGVMRCANAGHEYPMLHRKGGNYEEYRDPHTPVLAFLRKYQAKEYELTLQPGDSIFVYTDGIPEAVNTAEEQYGTERLRESLNRYKDVPAEELLKNVLADLSGFTTGAERFDDITMLGFRRL